MAASRNYSSTAGLVHLVGGVTGAATSLIVDAVTGLPTAPFTLLLDPGLGVEEIVEVTAVGGTTLTVTRGVDGTSAQAHANGSEVRHAYSARDFQDSRNHEANTTTAHGVTGAVVGTTNTQSLTNKTALAATSTTPGLVVKGAAAQTAEILQVQDGSAVNLVVVTANGYLKTAGSAVIARADSAANIDKVVLSAGSVAVDTVPIIATGFAGQTADLQQWKNSAGTVLAKVDAAGILTAGSLPGTNMGAPTTTTTNGTDTVGTTETRDAVLGNYVFTALAGRRYRACVDGLHVFTTVGGDQVAFHIRNGGTATPTATSTLVASQQAQAITVSVAVPLPLAGTFVPGAGLVTLGVFAVRVGGTGVATPWSPALARQLYAVDMGPA